MVLPFTEVGGSACRGWVESRELCFGHYQFEILSDFQTETEGVGSWVQRPGVLGRAGGWR